MDEPNTGLDPTSRHNLWNVVKRTTQDCAIILTNSHRQHIISWIDGIGQLSVAFDFTTKGVLQEAVKGQLWRLCDPQGKPPSVIQ
ncbi:probable alpha-amylase 2 [Rosa chinensis]|uniref:probable alpha-amylase 2 n=1 Tax=Rosa chinensis TaxID=74649 RepID=UPI001AD92840|nr:probable alpha-amylase 2 [Rosa chinensis]